MVDLLLKHNSKVDHQTKTGCTPLMEATRFAFVFHVKVTLFIYTVHNNVSIE